MVKRSVRFMSVENSLSFFDNELKKWVIKKSKVSKKNLFSGNFYKTKKVRLRCNPMLIRLPLFCNWISTVSLMDEHYALFLQHIFFVRHFILSFLKSCFFLVHNVNFSYNISVVNCIFYVSKLKVLNNKSISFFDFNKNLTRFLISFYFLFDSLILSKNNGVFPLFKFDIFLKLIRNVFVTFYLTTFLESKVSFFFNCRSIFLMSLIVQNFVKKITSYNVNVHFIKCSQNYFSAMSIAFLLGFFMKAQKLSFKRVLRNLLFSLKKNKNIIGLRIQYAGRFGRSMMAKTEWFKYGKVSMTTLTYKVDYGTSVVLTKQGICGIRVWLFMA